MRRQLPLTFLTVLILLVFPALSRAQSPGGVQGVELWLKTEPVENNLQGRYRWQDFSGDSVNTNVYDVKGAAFGREFTQDRSWVRTLNFNPALNLSEGFYAKESLLKFSNLSQTTIIGVFAPIVSDYARDAMLYAVHGRPESGTLVSKDKVLKASGTEALDYGNYTGEDLLYSEADTQSPEEFKATAPRILTYIGSSEPEHSVWGAAQTAVLTTGSSYEVNNVNFNTTFDQAQFGNNAFRGYTPELIVYNRTLTPLERKQVESYLAIRYGLTLKGSYYTSRGNLIWDQREYASYHHRVTGIARDKKSSLSQLFSTTSYEEGPRFTTEGAYDSYQDNNSYNLPTDKRLLMMGREYGSRISDGSYMLWGDNNASTSTQEIDAGGGVPWKIMDRKWLVKTNIDSLEYPADLWVERGIEVIRNGYAEILCQPQPMAGAYIISLPLQEEKGELRYRNPINHPSYDVGFATSSDTRCAYGFNIDPYGRVRTVIDGIRQDPVLAAGTNEKQIIVRREGRFIRMLVGGKGSNSMQVEIPEEVSRQTMCAYLGTTDSNGQLYISDLKRNGYGDSGNIVELGYGVLDRGNAFAKANIRQIYMLIDETGKGNFDPLKCRLVRCDHKDEARNKAVFNNVFIDRDRSKSDLFTFACFEGILAKLTPHEASCDGDQPLKDGSLDISILIGTPAFSYQLSADTVATMETGTVVSTGTFYQFKQIIDQLYPGVYELTIMQGSTTDVTSVNPTGKEYAYETKRYREGTILWRHSGHINDYRAGLCRTLGTGDNILHGFVVHDDTVRLMIDGKPLESSLSVTTNDFIGISFSVDSVAFLVNGNVVHREYKSADTGWFFGFGFDGISSIEGLSLSGSAPNLIRKSGSVRVETYEATTYREQVTVNSECDMVTMSQQETAMPADIESPLEDDATFQVKLKEGSERTFSAVLRNQSEEAQLVVYDAIGQIILQKQMHGEGRIRETEFTLPTTGVYVVKALTPNEEFTTKILANH